MDAIVWGFKHMNRDISETALELLLELLVKIKRAMKTRKRTKNEKGLGREGVGLGCVGTPGRRGAWIMSGSRVGRYS